MPTPAPRRSTFLRNFVGQTHDEGEYELDDITYNDDDDDDELEDESQAFQSEQVDSDLFPTMLVYRGGELVYTWIRVDWEADGWIKRKEGGSMDNPVEALLKGCVEDTNFLYVYVYLTKQSNDRHNIIQHSKHDNCGFSSDDEDLDKGDDHDDEIFDL